MMKNLTATMARSGHARCVAALLLPIALAACGGAKKTPARAPTEVGYVVVKPTDVPMTEELTGRAVAFQSSEVRPQVSGVIQKMLFKEGAVVKAGQPLYQIDPSLYRAAVSQAQANLASAQANQAAADALASRYKPLADIQAVSAQDYTNAVAQARQAAAQVGQAKAALETANINLRFTTVPAPISGRIGRTLFTVGALVTSSQADPLTTIQQLDPIYIDVQQSAANITRLRRALASGGGVVPSATPAKIFLEDGSAYAHPGSLALSEVVVDPATGTVAMRIRVPNPEGLVLPGMFLRAELAQSTTRQAYLVPQGALTRDPQGKGEVTVVTAEGATQVKPVTADTNQGANWVVTAGLASGDKVITEGLGNLRPGAKVRAVPAGSAQNVAPRKRGERGAAGAGPGGGEGGGGNGRRGQGGQGAAS